MFASVDPAVAEARGVPVRALGLAFVVLLALTITMAVQVVGTLLLFALVVTPAATALRLTARPARVAALAVALALGVGVGRAGALGDGRPAAELLHRVARGARLARRPGHRRAAPAGRPRSRSVDTHHPH